MRVLTVTRCTLRIVFMTGTFNIPNGTKLVNITTVIIILSALLLEMLEVFVIVTKWETFG